MAIILLQQLPCEMNLHYTSVKSTFFNLLKLIESVYDKCFTKSGSGVIIFSLSIKKWLYGWFCFPLSWLMICHVLLQSFLFSNTFWQLNESFAEFITWFRIFLQSVRVLRRVGSPPSGLYAYEQVILEFMYSFNSPYYTVCNPWVIL